MQGFHTITLTSVEAQNRFGQLLDMAQREPVSITRRGRPTAFMISPQEMQELHEARRARVWSPVASILPSRKPVPRPGMRCTPNTARSPKTIQPCRRVDGAFDVYRNKGAQRAVVPFVVSVQSAQFDSNRLRVVVPLVRRTALPAAVPIAGCGWNPVFPLDGIEIVLHPLDTVSVQDEPLAVLNPPSALPASSEAAGSAQTAA